jgi:hypothetical protein
LSEDRHLAFGEIARIEPVKHDHDDALLRACLALTQREISKRRGCSSDSSVLKQCSAAMRVTHGFPLDAISMTVSSLYGNIHPARPEFNVGF